MNRVETIGNCTLYLGDCLEVMPMLGMVDHVICDPPYEDITHKAKMNGRRAIRTDGRKEIKSLDFESIDKIREPFVKKMAELCLGWSLIFCSPEGVGRWADVINESAAKYKRACVWIKPDSTPQLNGQGPAMGAENFVASWHGSGHSKWNAGGKRGVYTHNTNNPDREGTHPTEKPLRLMRELLKDFTNTGETVLDPFMGSGTTGVACAKMRRKFIGIEIEERYFNIACKRIEEAYKQPDLFIENSEKTKQESFI